MTELIHFAGHKLTAPPHFDASTCTQMDTLMSLFPRLAQNYIAG